MRTHLCGQINETDIDQNVTLNGWVLNRRDHGGVIFIDLRDRAGRVQVVTDPDFPEPFTAADSARNEFVLQVTGKVRSRPEGTINEELATGRVEVLAHEIKVLSVSEPIPFQMDDEEIGEQTRLKFRYLDLRRESMQRGMRLRHRIISELRNYLNERDFVDIETPILTRSTPEGARDYLVPSRTYPGQFFALPQSPQLFKQLLMVAGFERYYQVARCFRDEDLRADRQPEFTQLDIEMSFMDEDELMALIEQMIHELFNSVLDVQLNPIPRLTYAEAVSRFGIDRPDLRIPMELTEVTDIMKDVEFKVFHGPANNPEGRVAGLRVPGGNSLSRAQIDQYTEFVKQYGAKGLAYIKVNDLSAGRDGLQSPILKFLTEGDVIERLMAQTGAQTGDVVFFGADAASVVNDALGALRIRIGHDLDMVEPGWKPVWVVDFPLVEWSETDKRWQSLHHPFTAPKVEHEKMLDQDPGQVLSRAYDLVMNGAELGGGSIRIHRITLQQKVLNILGIDNQQAEAKFGFLLDGLQYGAPPHGGIALGIDRLVAMMSGVESIRDVIAFPKTQKASCLLTEAPNDVDNKQLRELGLQIRKQPGS